MVSPLPDALIRNAIKTTKPFTMVGSVGIAYAIDAVRYVALRNVPGDIVECGVWKGGCSMAMMLTLVMMQERAGKVVHMFDSFEGLPAPQPIDGRAAEAWSKDRISPNYHDNCRADYAEVAANMAEFFPGGGYEIHRGWFEDTLPKFSKPISVLRIDCDWYSGVTKCLQYLMPLVSQGGIVIIDDYFAWDGCVRAVHQWMAASTKPYRIRSMPDDAGAYFVKV